MFSTDDGFLSVQVSQAVWTIVMFTLPLTLFRFGKDMIWWCTYTTTSVFYQDFIWMACMCNKYLSARVSVSTTERWRYGDTTDFFWVIESDGAHSLLCISGLHCAIVKWLSRGAKASTHGAQVAYMPSSTCDCANVWCTGTACPTVPETRNSQWSTHTRQMSQRVEVNRVWALHGIYCQVWVHVKFLE